MRVVFTTFSYFPETSGVPIVIKYLAEGLVELGHTVTVVTKSVKGSPEAESINGVQVVRFNIGSNKLKKFTGDVDKYVNFIKKEPKDVLILECLQCFTTDILLPHLKDMNCRKFIHSHGAPGVEMNYLHFSDGLYGFIANLYNAFHWKRYYKTYLPQYSKDVNACICLSIYDSTISYLRKHFETIKILENAADESFFDFNGGIDYNLNIKNAEYCLCVANYHPRKNQIGLVEEFFEAKTEGVSLVLIGSKENAYYYKVEKRVNELKMVKPNKDVVMLTGVPRKNITSLVSNAKLILLASEWEEYPVSLIEAMAVGTPFISNDVGNARILPGGVTVDNNIAMSSLIDLLLDNENLYNELSKVGKMYSADNNKKNIIIKQLESIIS